MLPLPPDLPNWYTVNADKPDDEKGWTPETKDIPKIRNTWNGKAQPPSRRTPDVQLNHLQIISPIQVGGGSFTEGGILPAQLGGVPCIPGSSLRGTFLHWLREHRERLQFSEEERQFWQKLVAEDWQNWQPRKVRFESVPLKNLQPYPLNAQQEWQIFGTEENEGSDIPKPARLKPVTKKQKARQQEKDSRKLGIQWQAAPRLPSQRGTENVSVQAFFKNSLNPQEQEWFERRLGQVLQQQGVGRGTASGFGRMAKEIPTGTWQIELKGMKPCSMPHQPRHNRQGEYRWSPQVLRACLRGYFTRLALSLMSKEKALALTNAIFGGASCRGGLTLTSYLAEIESPTGTARGYANIPATVAGETWHIQVDCNEEYRELVGLLLGLASQVGGLGPGWRRPPHSFKKATRQSHVWLYRGSEFAVTPANGEQLEDLIARLQNKIRQLAKLPAHSPTRPVPGGLMSIWEGKEKGKWWTIVHGVCSTSQGRDNKPVNKALEKPKPKRPCWCGDSEKRPSGYSVREYEDCCYITVFDRAVEKTLRQKGFREIWSERRVS